ncbi:MAG: hypothetical protein V4607_07735 [Pseudomonadota bacterium]
MRPAISLKWAAPMVFLAFSTPSQAGIYTDDMSRCLVSTTSAKDKADLVRWIFAVTALHPEVSSIAAVTEQQRDSLNQTTAKLIERLLTDACLKQTQEAIKYEGNAALQKSFEVLGQVAMQEMISEPSVEAGFAGFTKYLNAEKFSALSSGRQ